MADNDKRQSPPQPAEDFYGRPITPGEGGEAASRHAGSSAPREDGPSRDDAEDDRGDHRELTEADEKAIRPRTDDDDPPAPRELSRDASDGRAAREPDEAGSRDAAPRRAADAGGAHPYDPRERSPGAALDEMPDGDGPRSDVGTNPLSDVYRYGHPDRDPDRER